jgi:hypothetical protein
MRPQLFWKQRTLYTAGMTPRPCDRPRPIPTQGNTNTEKMQKFIYSYLDRDSKPRSQCSSGRRQFVSQTARPLLTGEHLFSKWKFYRHIYVRIVRPVVISTVSIFTYTRPLLWLRKHDYWKRFLPYTLRASQKRNTLLNKQQDMQNQILPG